jgi:CysZ protein
MLRNVFLSITPAYRYLLKDRVNLVFTIIPILIGLVCYYFFGSYVFKTSMAQGEQLIESYISSETWGAVLYYIFVGIMTVILFFLVNWTFVLFVSVIASPFNDMISSRVEKLKTGKQLESLPQSFKQMMKGSLFIVFNELKKVFFIIVLSITALVFSYLPFLAPVSFIITALLLASQFIDYTWSRHDLPAGRCLADVRQNFLGYAIVGSVLAVIITIPVVNLIVPPLASSYFTVLYLENNKQ